MRMRCSLRIVSSAKEAVGLRPMFSTFIVETVPWRVVKERGPSSLETLQVIGRSFATNV